MTEVLTPDIYIELTGSWSVWSKRLGKRLSSGQKAFLKFGMPMVVCSPFNFIYTCTILKHINVHSILSLKYKICNNANDKVN